MSKLNKKGLINRRFKVDIDVTIVEDRSGGIEELDCYLSKCHIDKYEKRFYGEENRLETEEQYRNYIISQFVRSSKKLMKQRDIEHYKPVADAIKNSTFWDMKQYKNWNMICLGARNEWEGLCFKKLLKVKVKTLDICEGPHPVHLDYLMDFNLLPKDWDEKWDIVFSNSIDHAENPTLTFFEWLRILKTDGIIVLGISAATEESKENNTNAADCSSLTEESVERFIDSTAKVDLLCKVPQTKKMRYTHYLLQKM